MCLLCFEHSWYFSYKQLCLLNGTVIRFNYKTRRWNANCKDLLFRTRMVDIMKCWSSINLFTVAMVSSRNCYNFVCFSFLRHVTVHLLFKMFNDEQSTGSTTYSIMMYCTYPLLTSEWFQFVRHNMAWKYLIPPYGEVIKFGVRFPLTHFLNKLRLPHIISKFYISLTGHHVMILGKWPTWRIILFYVFVFIFNSLHVSSTSCSSSGEKNCVNTTSGSYWWPCRVQVGSSLSTCTWYSHRHRVTASTGCIDTNCLSWWWARCARNM
jgi:hypothetical protein